MQSNEKSQIQKPVLQKAVQPRVKEELKAVSIHLPIDIYRALKIKAAKEGRTLRNIILESVNAILELEEKDN